MNYISLNKWALREGVNCSTSQKLYKDGKLTGAYEDRAGKLKRIKVPEDFHLPKSENDVKCEVCGREFPQITSTHLKTHDMTANDYKLQFPNAVMVGDDVTSALRNKFTGRKLTDEIKQKISDSRTGVIPKNHPRFVVGAYTASEETKRKMSESHTGLTHTEESKAKIGNAHRGKTQPLAAIEKQKLNICNVD